MPETPEKIIQSRIGAWRIHARESVSATEALALLTAPARIIKTSRKAQTSQTGHWVIKRNRGQGLIGILKRTINPNRYRQGWLAALYLEAHLIPSPQAHAFFERRWGPLILENALILEYLDGCVNVEDYARKLVAENADPSQISAYLARIADAVNNLVHAGARHTDLSGKNILTRDGHTFYFIDLDGILLGVPYTDPMRLKNHIELYDSFCDYWPPAILDPFILSMAHTSTSEAWLDAVHQGQQARRARHEERKARSMR